MVDIEIDDDQHEYLERLRSELAAEHVGDYGHVRYRDALQYLIDYHDSTDGEVGATPATAETDGEEPDERSPAEDDDTESAAPDDSASSDGAEADSDGAATESDSEEADSDGGGTTSRLQRMQSLLDDHDDVWERTDGEDGRYTVTLPDGSTESARTKDDVRALLFQHYD